MHRSGDEHAYTYGVVACMCLQGGYLAITDANLMLGRIVPDFFPKASSQACLTPSDYGNRKRPALQS